MTRTKSSILASITFIGMLLLLSADGSAQKRVEKEEEIESDSHVRAAYRYVIVYNDIVNDQRRIEILIQARDVNEKALRIIFGLIAERFPEPADLFIDAHVSLETIETPEEREMDDDSDDSRFKDVLGVYKYASYVRYDSGYTAILYIVRLNPYKDRVVVLAKGRKQ